MFHILSFSKKNVFFFLIATIQFTLIISVPEKCYSIRNCVACEELDFCDECEKGFLLNEAKTKCSKEGKTPPPKPSPKKETPPPPPAPSKKVETPAPKPSPQPQPQPSPNNPFKNLPISSFQRLKDRDMNNAIINKILIFILIVLILSIIASVIQSLIKKFWNKGYSEEELQDESAKVVYIK